mmetsp:Transcript_13386/g.30752  ORF Transcript_13386/g.30752 Transcript_13386/m.30752 type:complete len:102 (+) Transcript_13386:206-511(+)
MGNQGSVPTHSSEEWIVVTAPRSCMLQCCGYFELTTENIDGRLVQDIYRQAGGEEGLVPKVRKLASALHSLVCIRHPFATLSRMKSIPSFGSSIGRLAVVG